MQADLSPYIERAKQREISHKSSVKRRHDKAWELSRTAAELLRKAYGVKRVAMFGSVAQVELFHPGSDVDLVVWGLQPGQYFRVVGQLQALDPAIPIDLGNFSISSGSFPEWLGIESPPIPWVRMVAEFLSSCP